MLNLTARLALKIQNLPNWDFDWSDTRPQQSRQSLTISNFLPSEDDAQQLKKRAILYMMEFLATEFKSLADLKQFIPSQQSLHPVQKSVVVPMKVLFKDEKYKSETIDILTQLMTDAQLTGDPQVPPSTYTQLHTLVWLLHNYVYTQIVIGDQLTCKVIRGCKVWRQIELDAKDRLNWAYEIPGNNKFSLTQTPHSCKHINLSQCRWLPLFMGVLACHLQNLLGVSITHRFLVQPSWICSTFTGWQICQGV